MANKTWSANDLAFIIYAKYKGLNYKEIGELLDVSEASISMQVQKINDPSNYSAKTQDMVEKAHILEGQIRSGQYPDHRERWDKRISSINGMIYSYAPITKDEEPIENADEEVVEKSVDKPFIAVNVDVDAIVQIIKAWRGN